MWLNRASERVPVAYRAFNNDLTLPLQQVESEESRGEQHHKDNKQYLRADGHPDRRNISRCLRLPENKTAGDASSPVECSDQCGEECSLPLPNNVRSPES